MRRLILCLPLCFILAPEAPPLARTPTESDGGGAAPGGKKAADKAALPGNAVMERLARTDPIAFLTNCLRRYDREVRGYQTVMVKQERRGGVLRRSEVVEVSFREKPFSVLMNWRKGAERAQSTLYVEGQNGGKLLVQPAGWRAIVGVVERDPKGAEVQSSSRYPPTEFGMRVGAQRALDAWVVAKKRGDLKVLLEGEKKVKEAGNRLCWAVHRVGYPKPEDDGITDSLFYIDKGSWLLVGSVLKGEEGKLIGSYYFRDIKLNPDFAPDAFTRAALKRAAAAE
jgi:hypothetical protein